MASKASIAQSGTLGDDVAVKLPLPEHKHGAHTMTALDKISAKHYYDLTPSHDHAAGDIWRGLPSHGLLGHEPITGLIITPACDLTHRKSETATYLPVIPVRRFFSTPTFFAEAQRALERQVRGAQPSLQLPWDASGGLPSLREIDSFDSRLSEIPTASLSASARGCLERAQAGLAHLRLMADSNIPNADPSMVRRLVGDREWLETSQRIITNAHRTDLHFLPADNQKPEWSALQEHSVVLFRYPLTVPLPILDAAADLSTTDWPAELATLKPRHTMAESFGKARPLKVLRLRSPFLGDVLTRYAGLYIRLGSPDFTSSTIAQFTQDIG